MKDRIPSFLLLKNPETLPGNKSGSVRLSFIDKSIKRISGLIKNGYLQQEELSMAGLFQKIDARIKFFFMILLLLIVSFKREIFPEILIFTFILLLTLLSRLKLFKFYKRVFFFGFIFGFLIALPSSLNLITKGKIIIPLIHLSSPVKFLIYDIPSEIGVTFEGIEGVAMLTLRVVNSISVSLLVINTTQFTEIIKALKMLRVPDAFLMIITITYKYIFIFARTIEDIYLSMKSRITGSVKNSEMRDLIAGRMAFMFRKSLITCEDVYKAMVSRGFSEEIRIYSFSRFKTADWLMGLFFLISGILLILI